MTVQTSTNVASFNGDGANKVFPIGYKFNSAADLVVTLIDDEAKTTQILTLNSDFTVTGAGDEEGGVVTLAVAPTAVQRLKATRVVDILQLTDLRNQGKFYAEIHEDVFDLLIMIDQQQQTEIDDANAKSDEAVATANEANAKSDQAVAKAGQNLVDMQAQYDAFEQGAALYVIGDYAAGLVISAYNQIFRKDGEFYRAAASLDLSYTLTGNWATESVNFVSVGDNVLRQELAGESGGNMVGLPRLNGLAGRTVEDFAREKVSINDFYIPNQTDWTQGLADAATYMIAQAQAGTPKVLVFEPGAVYEASSFPNWRWHNIWLEGNNAILRNTGTGDTLIVDAGVDTYSLFNLKIGPFRIEGGPTSGHGCFVRSIHHSVIDVNIRGCGTAKDALHVNFSVCTEFRVAASSNQAAWYADAKPARGIVLDKRGTGEGVTACYFPNLVVEGVASIGLYLIDADQCSFVGGTSEGNGGANVECLADARHNTFDGIDLEVTGSGQGFSDYGRWNTWNNIYNDANSTIRAEAVGCIIRGGMHDAIIDNGTGTVLDGVRYGIAGGVITTTGNAVGTQQRLRPYNVTTGSFGANQLVDLSINGGATIKRHLRTSTALAASNLPAPSTVPGAVTLDLTVTGAQVGDIALATFSAAIPSTHLLRAQVVAANTVRITATQVSGAAASIIPSGATIYVDVWGH